MAERGEVSELSRTTARGFVKQNPYPKYKYIEDPADVVSTTYKEQFSQFNVEYHELLLAVSPMFGRFSGERVVFIYDWDKVTVMVENNLAYVMFLRPGTSPIEFERFCLHFVYSRNAQMILSAQEYDINNAGLELREKITPASLTVQCLRSVVVNMAKMNPSELRYLPNNYREQFCPKSFTEVLFHLWPRNIRGDSIVLAVKKGMIISEVLFLLEGKLKLEREFEFQLFKNCVPLEDDDFLQTDLGSYDCVFSSCKPLVNVTPSTSAKDIIVASLVGVKMAEIQINLSLPLKFLDLKLRQVFRLKPWSFLALYLPSEQRNIFYVGRVIYTSYEEEYAKFLISNGKRNFPKPDKCIETLPVKEMYQECSLFKKTLRCLGFAPGTLVEVFEITGPTIPVMYSGAVTKAQVIDVNPDWSLQTFFYYVKVNTSQASKIESVDYVRDCQGGKLADILHMMKNLWNRPSEGGRLEYLRLRSENYN